MSTYVMSDIHGQYDAYIKMLEKIRFSDEDFLYVLGDAIDRGPDGLEIIKDIMNRSNVELIIGNHELMLLNAVDYLKEKESNNSAGMKQTNSVYNPYELWTHPCNGGDKTCRDFMGLPYEEREAIEKYLRELRVIRRIKVGDRNYHLSHSYSVDKPFGKEVRLYKLSSLSAENVVWTSIIDNSVDADVPVKLFAYQRDIYVFGHIFTQRMNSVDENGKGLIYRNRNYRGYNIIDIDCGMALNNKSSQLACICLDNQKEFYVPLIDG